MSEQIATATMNLTRETKGAVLYHNEDEGSSEAVTNLYLRKSGLTKPYPEVLIVTIETERSPEAN